MSRIKKILVSFVQNLLNNGETDSNVNDAVLLEAVEEEIVEEEPKITEETEVSNDPDEKELDRLEELLKKALFGKEKKEKPAPVMYILNSGQDQWFYNPNSRSMVRVPGGSQLVVTDPEPDDNGRVLCYCDSGYILVPEEEISPLGYN